MVLVWFLGATAAGLLVKAARVNADRRRREERLLNDLRVLRERVDADREERRAA